MLEFIFELILEGISELVKKLKINYGLKIVIWIISIIAFGVLFVWLMNKFGIWK